jgi:lipopolysaccharide/colanic/teichoic acid biosynthesis glycosyltransferase
MRTYNSTAVNIKISGSKIFWLFKRCFDISISIALIPLLLVLISFLFIFNRYLNRGTIFYTQYRMGKDCLKFNAIKFRTMHSINEIERKYFEPVEHDRITPLGKFLRRSRLDELPQILNVLKGDMSLIGPRPDYYEHAVVFLQNISEYRSRHIIRPGITGLSQIRLGYAVGLEATKEKANVDQYYIKNAGFILDAKIFIITIITVFKGLGK